MDRKRPVLGGPVQSLQYLGRSMVARFGGKKPDWTGLVNTTRWSALHGYHVAFSDVAWLTCGVVHGSGVVGCGFHVVMCQSLPLLCMVVVIVRQLWPFVGQLSSFVVAVVCWAMAVICCMVAGVCCTVVVIWWLGLFAVVGVTWRGMGMVCWGGGGWELKNEANITGCDICFNIVETQTGSCHLHHVLQAGAIRKLDQLQSSTP